MTEEMFRVICTLGLTKLIELPDYLLASYEPWLNRDKIRWCLENLSRFAWEPVLQKDTLSPDQ